MQYADGKKLRLVVGKGIGCELAMQDAVIPSCRCDGAVMRVGSSGWSFGKLILAVRQRVVRRRCNSTN